tara:strand:- start:105 stop:572 length:468 start_codon:yes stop_codon:yes gene_type:complete
MNKIINYILLFFLIFLLSCGYKPILDKKNYQFTININNQAGDELVNSIIVKKFNTQKGQKKKYYINLISKKEKITIAKDSKGDPSIFELIINVEYSIKDNIDEEENLIEKIINKKTTYNNISDKFELEKYEKNIINNLSNNIANDIISSISQINE